MRVRGIVEIQNLSIPFHGHIDLDEGSVQDILDTYGFEDGSLDNGLVSDYIMDHGVLVTVVDFQMEGQ